MQKEASISHLIFKAGQKLAETTDDFSDLLNQTLNQLLVPPFSATKGFVRDVDGQNTNIFSTIIHTVSKPESTTETPYYNSDDVACVIDVVERLDVNKMKAAYERIACAKRLKKTPVQNGPSIPRTNVTLGIILTRDAITPIETLAEELDQLNRRHIDGNWTDMVVVFSKGTINYAIQFPGERISGDFLPPAIGVTALYCPPIYIVIVTRPTRQFTFNKMCSFIMAHLKIFSPDSKLPDWTQIVEGSQKECISGHGYQYNMSGKLLPVPEQFYNDRYIPPPPYHIKDKEQNILSSLQFLPWQDGGVILLKGKLPLDMLLLYLDKKVLKRAGIIRRNDRQISYALPISKTDFLKVLERFENQSNMFVKPDQTKIEYRELGNEGTSSPIIARLYLGILRVRDLVFSDDANRKRFDKPYQFVIDTLLSTRSTSKEIEKLVDEHLNKLTKGEVAIIKGNTVHIKITIDKELTKQVATFFNSGVRALKKGMQELTKVLQVDIGFLFQKQNVFENGITLLAESDPLLAAYLMEARNWTESLLNCRNAIEHDGWVLPEMRYLEESGIFHAIEPEISGQKVTEFVKFIIDRLNCFVEEVTVHCLQLRMPKGISITEIPVSQRKPDRVERFQVALTNGGMSIWTLKYHQSSFEVT